MNNIVGQKNLVSIFSEYTPATMPSTILLLGEKGAGKTYLTTRLAKQLNLDIVKLTSQTSAEDLIEYTQSPILKLYHIDLGDITEKAQNKFLKFIEEPSSTVKVILEAESEVGVLPTILNRCLKFKLEPYTVEELKSFAWAPKVQDPLIYKFYNTPGKLNTLGSVDAFNNLQTFCNAIVEHLPFSKDSDYANVMAMSGKISTKKDDTHKFDLNVFLDVFAYTAFEHYKMTGRLFSFKAYLLTIQQQQKMLNKTVAKEAAALSFINSLWEAAHDIKGA